MKGELQYRDAGNGHSRRGRGGCRVPEEKGRGMVGWLSWHGFQFLLHRSFPRRDRRREAHPSLAAAQHPPPPKPTAATPFDPTCEGEVGSSRMCRRGCAGGGGGGGGGGSGRPDLGHKRLLSTLLLPSLPPPMPHRTQCAG